MTLINLPNELRRSGSMALCPACGLTLATDDEGGRGRKVHQAQMAIQSAAVSRASLVNELRRCADGIAADPELAVLVVDDMEDEEESADAGQPQRPRQCPNSQSVSTSACRTWWNAVFDQEEGSQEPVSVISRRACGRAVWRIPLARMMQLLHGTAIL